MIEELEMTNWKTHRSTKLSFQKGINVLIGIMGAGKSSTTDAISYALFGNFPSLNSGRVNLEDIISSRPLPAEEAEVKLRFSADGKQYTVTRKIGKRGSGARLERDGAYLQSQPKKVTEEIEGILKVDYDTFSRAVYAEQNRLEYFLELREGERKKQIDRMLGLEAFATAEGNATSLINAIRSEIKYEEEALTGIDIKAINTRLAELKAEESQLSETQARLAARRAELKAASDQTKARLDQLKKDLQRKKDIEAEVVKLGSRISTLREEAKKIAASLGESDSELQKRGDELGKAERSKASALQEARDSERESHRRLSDLEAEVKQCRARVQERDRITKELKGMDEAAMKKELDAENRALQAAQEEIAAKRGRLTETADALVELGRHISKCPICERELSEELKERLVKEKRHAVQELEAAIRAAEKLSTEKASEAKKLLETYNGLVLANRKLSEYKDVDKALDRASKLSEAMSEATEGLERAARAREKELESARDEQAKLKIKLQAAERRRSYEADIKTSEASMGSKSKEASGIRVDEAQIERTHEDYTRQAAELSALITGMDGNSKTLVSVSKQLAEKAEEAGKYTAMESRVERRRSQLANLNKFKSALIDTEATLRTRIVTLINSITQGLWGKLYPYGDYSGLRLNATKDDYMLEFSLPSGTDGEEWVSVDRVGSGGERSVAALAMRIALAMVIVPNLKWLILDEPTHNIDSIGIARLVDVLGGALPQIVDQVFIITHDESMKQISSARIYQFDRDKGVNAPTSVSEI